MITPGLLRLALAVVLIPAPPPRETHWFFFPAQKLILNTTDNTQSALSLELLAAPVLLVLPNRSLGVKVPSLVLTREPIISSRILLRFSTVETLDDPPVALYLVHVGDALHPVLLPGHTGAVLGVVGHTFVLYHAQHHVLELLVEVAVSDLTDVGAHGLLVPGLGELTLRGAVHGGLAVLVLHTAYQAAQAVVAHTGGDGEEVGVRGGPVYVLADSPGPYVDTEVEEAGRQEEVAERNHRVQLQTGVKTEVFNLSVILLY